MSAEAATYPRPSPGLSDAHVLLRDALSTREESRWQACLDPGAELHEVKGSHSRMGMNRAVWKRLADLLGT